MANLLPIESKKHVRKEYFMRLGVLSLLSLALLIAVALALLAPSYIFSESKYNLVTDQLVNEKSKTATPQEEEENRKIIRKTNSMLGILAYKATTSTTAYATFKTIIEHKTRSIKIYSLFFSKNAKNITVSLSGVAATRAPLFDFMKALEEDGAFSAVDLPISNFVKERDIGFSIQITIPLDTSNNKSDE